MVELIVDCKIESTWQPPEPNLPPIGYHYYMWDGRVRLALRPEETRTESVPFLSNRKSVLARFPTDQALFAHRRQM